MATILGIDLGTSSIKAMLLDDEIGEIGVAQIEQDVLVPALGYAEQDPRRWWTNTLAALAQLRARFPAAFDAVRAIGLSGQMHGVVFCDRDGAPLYNAIIWLDQRAKENADDMLRTVGFSKTAEVLQNRPFTGFAIPSLLWFKNQYPAEYARIRFILNPKDFLRLQLTHAFGCDVSDASSTAGFDVHARNWAFDVIETLGIPADILPTCHESMEIAGTLTKCVAELTGLSVGIPVIYGAGDHPCAAVGSGIIRENMIFANIGTGAQISVYSTKDLPDAQLRTQSYCHALDGAFIAMGAMLCGGMSLKWLRNEVLHTSLDYDALTQLAAQATPGCDGLVYLPYLTGERTPHMNPAARGVFFGLTLRHDQNTLIRSVLEGVTYALRDCLTLLNQMGIQNGVVIASGGGARSAFWLQLQADILNVNVRVCNVKEQACLGACMLAGVGAGLLPSVPSAVERFVTYRPEIYTPATDHAERYNEAYALYRSLYGSLQPLFV